ncbi:DUF5988 family protein [Streptomyces sp. H10-C2]|uniref:DUF5988 family protein n=1 Tax=unclassified Streptomyces TaxID=2593676 RepID=UPI0024BB3EAF|nr:MULTISPECIES: DUF5988 family protein [unclassified Streptomyces]MDJ0346722.1 DUF5988 family protein [Streptomyces sp. PH10-H1]MDJ0375160.1 DUF5988 family protein [Streptomyces sp. H10-C2]
MKPANVNTILRGGSMGSKPVDERLFHVKDPAEDVLKIFLGNRYEHYYPTVDVEELDGRALHIFDWSHNTYVAE